MTPPVHLVWFRNDLRVHDNPALHDACCDPQATVIALWMTTPQQWIKHDTAACRIEFDLRTVAELSASLADLNIPLLIRHCNDFHDVPAVVQQVCRELAVTTVFANREYPVYEIERDQLVHDALAKSGIALILTEDQCILPPGTLKTGAGDWYSVFTPFKRAWISRLSVTGNPLLPIPARRPGLPLAPDRVPSAIIGINSHVDPKLWPAGEKSAISRLNRFCKDSIRDYKANRDYPAIVGTSSLSPWLANGSLSPRLCLNKAIQANEGSFDRHEGASTWISELCWRDFYKHILVGFPRVSRHQPVKLHTQAIAWRNEPDEFEAWSKGNTGYPLVDAAMRQLNATGWMHNRLRMIVAMFFTKDLMLDWRLGEKYFMQHLIDGDLAANNGGWQWSASTGNDAVPYFRIFNPVTQSEKFDPQGTFIRKWVPEIAHLDNKDIHAPWLNRRLDGTLDYPSPLVDHASARERTLLAFKKAGNGDKHEGWHERPASGASGTIKRTRKQDPSGA